MAEWNRSKRKRKTIEIQYSPGESLLKVKKISGKHLETMGIPGKSCYHLYPEEAVYLMETGSATITTPAGHEMSLLEAFSILEALSVSMTKYEIYKQVKLTGLVVLRPRKLIIDHENLRVLGASIKRKFCENTFEMLENLRTVPHDVIPNPDSFPAGLHTNPVLVNFLPPDVLESIPTVTILRNLLPPTQRPTPCRPSYMPATNCRVTNWEEYRFQAEKARQAMVLKRFRKLRPPSVEQLRRERITVDNVDYHVFSPASFSHRLPARPLFSIICYSAVGPPLKIAELAELRNVIFAMEQSGKINYVTVSGAPIDLNEYLC